MNHEVSRRAFIGGTVALLGVALIPFSPDRAAAAGRARALMARAASWPSRSEWAQLRRQVGGRLLQPQTPWEICKSAPKGQKCSAVLQRLHNPFFNEDHAGASQTTGWLGAWTSTSSAYVVAVESVADIVAAVNFAREHEVRVVVKGTGHDYLGRSNGGRALMIWTHKMRDVTVHQQFRPAGAPATAKAIPALSVQAGARWLEAFAAATKAGRYVQGGGCTSVGACGGFILGSGFGPFSKRFGTGAAGVLEIEVVTADGELRIANAYQNADLFWALRGGGGGTFGVVSRMTLMTHPMPKTVGVMTGSITATSDAAYRALLRSFVEFYPDALNNPTWGESVALSADNTFGFRLTFLDKTQAQAEAVFAPFLDLLRAEPANYTVAPSYRVLPFKDLWNYQYWDDNEPDFITHDPRPEAPAGQFWWSGNQGEVSAFINSYQSRWVPLESMTGTKAAGFAEALYDASRLRNFIFQINKGLSGEAAEAATRDHQTALHPSAYTAAALVIIVSSQQYRYVGVPGYAPNRATGRQHAEDVGAAMDVIAAVTPGGGAYANEADYFQPNWQEAFWGGKYERLLRVKRKYDPDHVFTVHHGVGSEFAP